MTFHPTRESFLNDSEFSTMARLILGVTGSVAAIRTPALYAQLHAAGHEVRVVATRSSLYFFDPAVLGLAQGDNGRSHHRRTALSR